MLLSTWADTHCCFSLVQQLGRLGSGWQPSSKIGEAGEPRRAAKPVESGGLPTARGLGWGARARGSSGGLI
jgi:hypothetical protein